MMRNIHIRIADQIVDQIATVSHHAGILRPKSQHEMFVKYHVCPRQLIIHACWPRISGDTAFTLKNIC